MPILISGVGTQQLLSFPKLNRSTGAEQDKIQILRQSGSYRKQKKNDICFKNRDRALKPSKSFSIHGTILQEMPTRGLDEFVTKPMQTFFDQLEIEMEFLETGVALIHDYNRLMTKNEDQM